MAHNQANNAIFKEALHILEGKEDLNGKKLREGLIAAMLAHVYQLACDNNTRLDALEKLVPYIKGMIWVMTGFATSVIILIWSILIGKVELIFK